MDQTERGKEIKNDKDILIKVFLLEISKRTRQNERKKKQNKRDFIAIELK